MVLSCLAGCSLFGDKEKPDDDEPLGPDVSDGPPQFGTGSNEDEGNWWEKIKYKETDLLFMMTNCDNAQELSSGCEQYLAGQFNDSNREDPINTLITQRNEDAYELTRVNVTYDYYPNEQKDYGFSYARKPIYKAIMSQNSATPDMYCNWMTDLLICSLQGCFANLYSRSYGEGDFKGMNHFNLDNHGYMADLMGSLTLSTQKIYVVASDYFIDLIRAFFVVPVNVTLFNQIADSMYEGVANPDINTFFDEVKPCDCTNYDTSTRCHLKSDLDVINGEVEACPTGNWTYDRLMQFSEKIYQASGTDNKESINDRLGFALGKNGLPAAGLIYTSSVVIINKEWDSNAKKYNYAYPATNQKLYDLVGKVSEMMDTPGVYFATQKDAESLNYEGEKTALLGIRNQFVNDMMLFGGIILVGSLEYKEYQNMKTEARGGFGVVPVPVYEAGDNYLTQIHVVGRAGAIRYNTTKFVQCSAFLHYQSCNSQEIKDDYYEYTLVHGAAGGPNSVEGNIEMLQYIRQNVRTSFDKLFEDAIGFMYEDVIEDSAKNRFHALLSDNSYQYTGMSNTYEKLYSVKSQALANLEEDYSKLPK